MVAAVVLLWEHMLEVEASRRGLGGSSSWDYMCFHIGHQWVAYFGLLHLHVQPSNPLLREQLSSALLGGQWTGS